MARTLPIAIPPPPPRDTPPPRATRKVQDGVYLVYGARNGAVYDLRRGEVHWLERETMDAYERGERVLAGVLAEMPESVARALAVHAKPPPRAGDELPVARRTRLRFLWIELSQGCNLACGHCYASSGGGHRTAVSTEGYGRLLDEAAALGCGAVQLTGGEPLVHPDFLAVVDRALAHRMTVEVYSNLALLTDELADALAARKIELATSFYSDRAADHEAVTRVPGSFDATVAGIRRALARKIPLRVGVVLQGAGAERRAATTAFLRDLGVDPSKVGFDSVRPGGRGAAIAAKPGPPPFERDACTRSFERAYARPLSVDQGRLRGNNCWGGELNVAASGEVGPCIFERRLAIGRVGRDGEGLAAIADGERAASVWRITLEQCRVCRDCEFRYSCFDCRFLAFAVTGDLYAKPPGCSYDPTSGRHGKEAFVPLVRPPRRREDLIVEEVEDGLVLFDEARGVAHALSPTAAAIFELLDGRRDPAAIAAFLAETTGADGELVRADVERTLDELAAKDLLVEGRPS